MADVEMLAENWKESPPLAECVRAALGVKPPESSKSSGLPSGECVRGPTEITQAEYDSMASLLRASVEAFGVRRN